MSEVLSAYLILSGAWFMSSSLMYFAAMEAYLDFDKKWPARAILVTPFWPIFLLILIALGALRLIKDAIGKEFNVRLF